MKITKVCSLELLVLLLCLMCFSSEGHVAKKTRGYRGNRRRDLSQADINGRALKGVISTPTTAPTFEPTKISKKYADDDEEDEEEPEVLQAAEKEDKEAAAKEEDEETDAPTASPTVEETTVAPTFDLTTGEPTDISMVAAKEDKETPDTPDGGEEETTDAPTGMPTTTEPTTESPTIAPTAPPTTETTNAPTDYPTSVLISEANELTIAPAVGVTNSPSTAAVDESASTLSPTGADAAESAVGPTTSTSETDPYYVRLEPLYMTVSLSEGDFNEENFMDVLIDYMDYNMVRDLERFESITYGISTFSQITFIPDSIGRSQNTSAVEDEASPPIVSNTTVHIHLLTATFEGTPTQPDLVITEYMEMLLENGELFQEYIDTETQLDAKIDSITLEFEETVQPTTIQDNSGQDADPNSATAEDGEKTEEEENNSVGQIVGITVGCFLALVWIVLLWGVQSRAVSS